MKIAVITSGILPVPAVLGGAVENLIDFYLRYNEEEMNHDITVYSVYDKMVEDIPMVSNSTNIHFSFIRDKSIYYRLKRNFFGMTHKSGLYYNHYIEFFLYNVLKRMKNKSYDIILLENRPGYAVKLHQAFPSARIILHLHNDLLNSGTLYAHEIRNILSSIIAVSSYIKKRVDSIELPSKTKICYNGINLKPFNKNQLKLEVRSQFGFDDSDFIVVFSGRMIPEKGVKELLEGYLQLVSSHHNIKLLIVGGSFFGNDLKESPYIKGLRELVLPYRGMVEFTGYMPYDRVPELLQCADIGIVPSIWDDPCPLSCIEGMAAGLPLIVTNSGGIPEIVDEKCAIILEKEQNLSNQIAKSIYYLYNNPDLRKKMSRCAVERAELLFSKDHFARNFFGLMKE